MTEPTEICGVESRFAPGKFCHRPPHDGHSLHIFQGLPHDGKTDIDLTETVLVRLPVAALEALRREWEDGSDEDLKENATALIRDVFGGIDGHLTRIDDALGVRT